MKRMQRWGAIALLSLAVMWSGTLPMVEAGVQATDTVTASNASEATGTGGVNGWTLAEIALYLSLLPIIGATLAVNKPRIYEMGNRNEYPVIAADIIYEGAGVGVVDATGHARPLNAADRFVGFAEAQADNSAGAAAAIRVRVVESGKIQLSVTGAVITDVGQPVYATDDDTFVFSPVGGAFVGFVHRFVSAGVVVVAFDAVKYQDPYGGFVHELKSANYTVDAEDAGKWIWNDTDNVVITLPAVEGIAALRIGTMAAFGTVKTSVDPAAADMIEGPDITAADNKDIINTKATQRRGDFIEIGNGDANGWSITRKRGIWAREA